MNDPGFWEKVLGAKPAQRLLNDLTQGKLDGAKAEAIEVYITGGHWAASGHSTGRDAREHVAGGRGLWSDGYWVAMREVLMGCLFFPLIHRSHSISFTRAQGVPKYKIGFGRGK
jgi:hypothetical protein